MIRHASIMSTLDGAKCLIFMIHLSELYIQPENTTFGGIDTDAPLLIFCLVTDLYHIYWWHDPGPRVQYTHWKDKDLYLLNCNVQLLHRTYKWVCSICQYMWYGINDTFVACDFQCTLMNLINRWVSTLEYGACNVDSTMERLEAEGNQFRHKCHIVCIKVCLTLEDIARS